MLRVSCGSLSARTAALALLCLVCGAPAPASAWTSTELASADAHVHLWPTGRALVGLTLGLTVRGGWLSRFEVAGLDPGARLDPDKPPSLLCEDGRKVAPRAELRPDGTLVLEFDRASAPRRGRHRLDLLYTTQLAFRETDRGTRKLSWSMPAWRVDLADVDLWINAPEGARLATGENAELDGAASRRQLARGGRTVMHLHRVQLPRTLPFGFELELPARAAPLPAPRERVQAREGDAGQPAPLWLGAAVFALAWLKRSTVRARCRRFGGRPVPLIALQATARLAAMLALALAGALAYASSPPFALGLLAAVVALGLDLRIAAPRAASARRSRSLPRVHDLLGATSWLDATTLPGCALLASAFALGVARVMLGGGLGPWLEFLLLVAPLWLTATRLHAPWPSAPERPTAARAPHTPALSPSAAEARRAPDRAA